MDIKNLLNSFRISSPQVSRPVERTLKAAQASDRDANGQQARDQQNPPPEMTDEKFEQLLEKLRTLPAFVEGGLTVEVVIVQSRRFVDLKEPNGKLVRRLRDTDLWSLEQEPEQRGRVLNKSA